MTDRTVLIFAKPPRMGLSKTRLAAGLGRTEAARIARFTMARTLRAANDQRWRTILYAAPDAALGETLGGLWPTHLARVSQGHGDLGDRLSKGLKDSPHGMTLFIGADAPSVTAAHLWQAFIALKRHDAVFGPSTDGGFWLFGLNKRFRTRPPFSPVRWSGPHAMEDVRANLTEASRVAVLPTLVDIDDADDWAYWCRGNSPQE